MTKVFLRSVLYASLLCVLSGAAAWSQTAQKPATQTAKPAALGLGGQNQGPIKIDADRLDVFDKDKRAVFQGNVVAVQGETTIHCTTMTVLYEQKTSSTGGEQAAPATAGNANAGNAVRRIDCAGPVTVLSSDQTATGDSAIFDRAANKMSITGNAVLTQGTNVTRGDKVLYDLNTGIANVEVKTGGRVKALFTPGEENTKGATNSKAETKAK